MTKAGIRKVFKRITAFFVAEVMTLLLTSCGNSERQAQIEYISEKYNVPEENRPLVYS